MEHILLYILYYCTDTIVHILYYCTDTIVHILYYCTTYTILSISAVLILVFIEFANHGMKF